MITYLPRGTFPTKTHGPSNNFKGTVTPGVVVDGFVRGTLNVTTPSDIALLEEGKRTQQAFILITDTPLQTALPGLLPAWVEILNVWFEVSALRNWQNTVISHYEYIITKIENPQDYQ